MTKIDIFSGFLGAGKTTLIKKLIKESFAGQKVVLIGSANTSSQFVFVDRRKNRLSSISQRTFEKNKL